MDDLVRLLDLLGPGEAGAAVASGAGAGAGGSADVNPSTDPPLAVATVVNTRGSAYRRPGARMLIRHSMSVQGAVSAGCLERDIIAHCEGLAADSKPLLLTYDGTSSDELIFGLRLGCDGIVQILLEPVGISAEQLPNCGHKFQELGRLLPQLLDTHRRLVAVTLFDLARAKTDYSDAAAQANSDAQSNANPDANPMLASVGLVLLETGTQAYELNDLPACVSAVLSREARRALLDPEGGRSFVLKQEIDGYFVCALIEFVEPITSLLVFGGGQDLDPLVKMAAVLGWPVTVAGNAQVDRLEIGELSSLIGGLYPSAAVVMTHDYERDRKILQALFASIGAASSAAPFNGNLPYIGVVGPRRRADKLLAELALAGVPITEDELSRLFSPVGLDLGAERPEEIALSILAEIKAVLAGHRGGLLREKQGPIHEAAEVKTSDGVFSASGAEASRACKKSESAVSTSVSAASDPVSAVETRTISASCRLDHA